MARYTNGTEVVDAIAWDGNFSNVTAFVTANPPIVPAKVTEDNPSAIGVIEQPPGSLTVFTEAGYEVAALGDFLIRGADLKLRTSTAVTFNASFHLV
jgi:hypothetical protein